MRRRAIALALLVALVSATTVQAQQTGGWSMTGSLTTQPTPTATTATLLMDGKVLVVGGTGTELYDPQTGQWSPTGNLITPRDSHSAVRLANGKVLVAGGMRKPAAGIAYRDRFLTSVEIYDPATGAWSAAGNLSLHRTGHTATLLADGTVLVVGGSTYEFSGSYQWYRNHSSAEIYDPATGTWSTAGTMPSPHDGHESTLLANGTVLVFGGRGDRGPSRRAELFDPVTRIWAGTGNLTTGRYGPRAILLPNGKVLATGGSDGFSGLDTAELYDPATGQWSPTGGMIARRFNHTATLLHSGRVLVVGGHADLDFDDSDTVGVMEWDTAEIYDPGTGQWSATGSMSASCYGHTATLLTDGRVLVAGGYSRAYWSSVAELYDAGLPLLTLNSTNYCVGNSWNLRVNSLAPNTWTRLAGASNGQPWELVDWRKTDDSGSFSETGTFGPDAEGVHILSVDVGGKVSNKVSLTVARCQIQLTLNLSDYCTGAPWNLKVMSDFPNARINLSGTTNNEPWEIVDWGRTGPDGNFAQTGTFAPGSEGVHTLRVRIGTVQSALLPLRVSRCGP
jgi:galactose oxidase-like protein/Kelch motif protein